MSKTLPQSVDQMQDIIDIADVYQDATMPLIRLVLAVLVFVLVAIILFYLGRFMYRRFFKKEHLFTPEERGRLALATIRKQGYLGRGAFRELYFSLDETLRIYLHQRHGHDVVEKTFEELSSFDKNLLASFSTQTVTSLLGFWRRSQQVKFAKESVSLEEAQADFKFVEKIIG